MTARALARPLPAVVARLIPRLASNFDGEILATVAAIRRTLESENLDLHDLARAVTAPAQAPPTQWDYRTENAESSEIRAWLEAVAGEEWPNDWTREFIDSILRRPNLDRLSKKQIAVINNIVEEAMRRGVRPGRRAA